MKKVKELLFDAFNEGNRYACMPEDDINAVEEDFEKWYKEINKNDFISDIVSRSLLEEILLKQEEVICSPRRDVVILAEYVKSVFAKYGIKLGHPF